MDAPGGAFASSLPDCQMSFIDSSVDVPRVGAANSPSPKTEKTRLDFERVMLSGSVTSKLDWAPGASGCVDRSAAEEGREGFDPDRRASLGPSSRVARK